MVEFEFDVDWGRAAWIGFGIVLGLAILYVVVSFIGTFVFALFIYYSTRKIHGRVVRRVGQPTVAAALSLTLLALPAVILLYYTLAIGLQELQQFSQRSDLAPYFQMTNTYFNVSDIVEDPATFLQNAGGLDLVRTTLDQALNYVGFIGTGLLHLFVMFAVAFYLLRDGSDLKRYLSAFSDQYGALESYAKAVDRSLEKIFAGNILNAVVTGAVGAISYSVLNVVAPDPVSIPYPALIGLLAGIASLIPVVGMKLVYVPVTGWLSVQAYTEGSGWGFVVLFAVVSFVIVDAIPDFVVRPYVAGGSLHTGTVMFAYILGPLLFGWYGIFLAPIILVLVTHFVRLVVPELLAGREIRPFAVDPATAVEPPPQPMEPLADSDGIVGDSPDDEVADDPPDDKVADD